MDLDAEYGDAFKGHLTLLWEEDDTEPVDVDEGWLRYELSGFFVSGGRTYTPFGEFETFFISDPLTLELAETCESALVAGCEKGAFSFTLAVFNGELYRTGTASERLRGCAFAFDFAPSEAFSVRLSYQSNIAESDGLLAGALTSAPQYVRRVGGWHVSARLTLGGFGLIAEAVAAERRFSPADLDEDGDGEGDRPLAWNFEAGWSFERGGASWTVAGKVEGARETPAPELQGGFCVSFRPDAHTTLSLEALHRSFDEAFGAPWRDGYAVSLQAAFSF